jgi:hypothetical protein
MMALGRKIIAYRDVDIPFAVACLSTVPFDSMVKELKSAVPSIQSDFSRLRTVAMIGEQLSQMWQQEESLLLFQSLQTNAKWWHILSSHGIKIDSRAFQSPNPQQREECIRSVVPLLLKKTGDISLAMEYCNQFDLEAHFASTCFIEHTLVAPPTLILSSEWSNRIKKVSGSVEERAILHSLRQILPQIHPLDYEKVTSPWLPVPSLCLSLSSQICYTCKWLLDILSEEEIDSRQRNDDASDDDDHSAEQIQLSNKGSTTTKELFRSLIEESTRYLHVATLLTNLSISTKMDLIFPDLADLYAPLAPEYSFRLPFWKLIADPWALLEPLMIADADIGPKLSPLCPFLSIERDDFYVKRAIHLYTRSSLQSIASPFLTDQFTPSSPISEGARSHSSTAPLTPQMESLLKEIDEIASCTKKPLTRVKIWRLVYEMEKDRNASVALKALETALQVFDQISSLGMISDADLVQTYKDIKYETLLEMVKHKSRETLLDMQNFNARLTQSNPSLHWETTILPSDHHSILSKLAPHLGDISALLKVFFESLLEEAWVLQLKILRKTATVLSAYDLLDQKLLPVISEYLKYAGEVAVQLYEIHLTLDSCSQEDLTAPPTSALTSSVLQSIRHGIIGRLLADVDTTAQGADSHSRVMKSASQSSSAHVGGSNPLMSGLWGTISSTDSVVSPSSAEFRRREDVYRAFGIATLLATCTSTCPR